MNLYNRIKAKIVGWHADYYTSYSRLEDKYKDKEYPGKSVATEETTEEPEEKESQVSVRVYTQALAQELAEKMKEDGEGNFGRMRIRHSFPHVRVVPEPAKRMQYPGTGEQAKILDYLSENGWTELAVVGGTSKSDGQFQFQGRFAGGLYSRYEVYLGVRQVDEPLDLVKPQDLHNSPKPVTWIEGTKINETAS